MPGTPSFPAIMAPEMAVGKFNSVTTSMSAGQWEAVAAALQERLFAIHDLAERHAKKPWRPTEIAKAIVDLCRQPHAELVKKGLLS